MSSLRRRLLTMVSLVIAASSLAGCIIVPAHPYYHPYWHRY